MNELKNILNKRQLKLLNFFEFKKEYAISDIYSFLQEEDISLATLKRDLTLIEKNNFLIKKGIKRTLKYILSDFGLIQRPFDLDEYGKQEEREKRGNKEYNFELLNILKNEEMFNKEELRVLNNATKKYKEKTKQGSEIIHKKELERFIIELSWKSSKIEGNTYTLLDTEKLLKEGVESTGHTKDEAIMILNHKKSFDYILLLKHNNKTTISFREIENIHRILIKDLGVNHGLRKSAVGITGSIYLPLDISSRIEEELKSLIRIINSKKDSYTKALLSIAFISYLQPFEDGNKRTSRLFGNGVLIEGDLAPLSYRNVDEKKYREAMLVFYEQNSLQPFKEIFIEQYIFACENYNLKN